jgi:hypothetical protein
MSKEGPQVYSSCHEYWRPCHKDFMLLLQLSMLACCSMHRKIPCYALLSAYCKCERHNVKKTMWILLVLLQSPPLPYLGVILCYPAPIWKWEEYQKLNNRQWLLTPAAYFRARNCSKDSRYMNFSSPYQQP